MIEILPVITLLGRGMSMAEGLAGPIGAGSGATPDQPQTAGRVESLDLIRGIAVMGIVISNMTTFAAVRLEHQWPIADGPLGLGEQIVWFFQYLLIDGKLRGIFSLLFGAGIAIFIERSRAKGGSVYWLQLRRLFWLMAFAVLHYFLFFTGDILHDYAMAGVLVLLFLWIPPKWLVAIGVLLTVANSYFPASGLTGFRQFEEAAMAAPADSEIRQGYEQSLADELAEMNADTLVKQEGSFADVARHRIENDAAAMFEHPERSVPSYFFLMLIGVGLYRMGFFSGAFDRSRLIRFGLAGIALSTALSVPLGLWTIEEGFPRALHLYVFYGPVDAVRLPMILGYTALLVAFSQAILQSGIGERIAAAGRTAFTNYIGASILAAIIFQGWGLGLFNQFDKVERLGFILLFCLIMLLWSKPWLERFRFGPLEWAWRCLTYWRLFPIKRDERQGAGQNTGASA